MSTAHEKAEAAAQHVLDVKNAAIQMARHNYGGLTRYEMKRVRNTLAAAEHRMYERWLYYKRLARKTVDVPSNKGDAAWLKSAPTRQDILEIVEHYRRGYTVLHNLIEIADVAISMSKV